MNDPQLLREYLDNGSERAFQDLVRRHVDMVYSTALRRLNDAGCAEEVTQNVFAALARKAPFLGRDVALTAWLHKSALLEARHRLRAELRRKRRQETAVVLGVTMKEDDSLLKSLSPVLDETLMELRQIDRQAVLLRYFENKSLREVGEAFGVGEDAAQKRLAKALEQLTRAFRRRGYSVPAATAIGAALHGATQSAPAGLALVAAQTALQSSGALSLSGLGMMTTKLMGLTKMQTVALCLVVSIVPMAYEGGALANARSGHRRLVAHLSQIRYQINDQERAVNTVDRKLRFAEKVLADSQDPSQTGGGKSSSGGTAADPDALYLWDEQSEYVRLPKKLASNLTFGEFEMQPRGKARPERVQRSTLAKDGTPSPALLDALGLSDAEQQEIGDVCRISFAEFGQLAAAHSYFTNLNFSMAGNKESVTLFTPAFPDEGKRLRRQWWDSFVQTMGEERTRLYWQQAENIFRDALNEFGQAPKAVTVSRDAQQNLDIDEMYFRPDGSPPWHRSGTGAWIDVPDSLKPYIEAWKKPSAFQTGGNHK